MIIYSDKTGKKYKTVEECEAAEKEYDAAIAKKEEQKKQLEADKKMRAGEVVDAYKAAKEAEKKYVKLRNEFIRDYGYFHMSFRDSECGDMTDLISLFKFW